MTITHPQMRRKQMLSMGSPLLKKPSQIPLPKNVASAGQVVAAVVEAEGIRAGQSPPSHPQRQTLFRSSQFLSPRQALTQLRALAFLAPHVSCFVDGRL